MIYLKNYGLIVNHLHKHLDVNKFLIKYVYVNSTNFMIVMLFNFFFFSFQEQDQNDTP